MGERADADSGVLRDLRERPELGAPDAGAALHGLVVPTHRGEDDAEQPEDLEHLRVTGGRRLAARPVHGRPAVAWRGSAPASGRRLTSEGTAKTGARSTMHLYMDRETITT